MLFEAKQYFWKILFVNILSKIASMVFLFATGLFLLSPFSSSPNAIATFILFLLFFLANIVVNLTFYFLSLYANAYIIIREEKFWKAIQKGFFLFRENPVKTIEVAAILFLINIVVSLGGFMSAILFSLPFFLFLMLSLISQSVIFAGISLIAIGLIFLSILLIIGSGLGAFQTYTWILFFNSIADGKIKETFRNIFKRI